MAANVKDMVSEQPGDVVDLQEFLRQVRIEVATGRKFVAQYEKTDAGESRLAIVLESPPKTDE